MLNYKLEQIGNYKSTKKIEDTLHQQFSCKMENLGNIPAVHLKTHFSENKPLPTGGGH